MNCACEGCNGAAATQAGFCAASEKPPRKRAIKAAAPTGFIIYRGPSAYDGSPIVVVLHTGNAGNTKTTAKKFRRNVKRGLSALWIMPDTGHARPVDWIRLGHDKGACGTCVPRSKASGGEGTCYTHGNVLGRGGSAIWKKLQGGGYRDISSLTALEWAQLMPVRPVRSAAYGDAGALPVAVWGKVERAARMLGVSVRGYTHAWATGTVDHLRGTHMASCETAAQVQAAQAAGWRTFRARKASEPILASETGCPASAEGGHRTTCDVCTLCSGGMRPTSPSVSIILHGPRFRAVSSLSLSVVAS